MKPNNRLEEALSNLPPELLTHYRQIIDLQIQGVDPGEPIPFYTLADLKEQYEASGKPTVLSTGWKELDNITAGGIAEGEVVLLAGQSGIGKTHFGVNLSINLANKDKRVFYITLEDGWKMVCERFSAMDKTGKSAENVFMMHEDSFALKNAGEILERGIKDADLIILDNLFAVPVKSSKTSPIWEAQAEFVDMVCNTIRSTKAAALIMHHLNKTPEGTTVERYQIAGSTRLINRVGQVWLLFHSDKYPETKGVMGIKVEKNRRSIDRGECFLRSDQSGKLYGMLETQVYPKMLDFVKTQFSIEV